MPQPTRSFRPLGRQIFLAALLGLSASSWAAPDAAVWASVQQQKQPLLGTLRDLVAIESGSGDREGLDRISQLIFDRLQALGGQVQFIEAPANAYRMQDTPAHIGRMVKATFKGEGSKKILLIAHMDTVYLKGMGAKQPYRVEGNKAYGLGIGDDKAGIAVILHTLATLQAINFKAYGQITVLINGDEEISSPGSRQTLTQLGQEHDLTLSVNLKVTGKASHAGSAPERGLNAIYELSHQILQTRNFSDPSKGVKMNWTLISGGTNRNVIPAEAKAAADVRVERIEDYANLESKIASTIQNTLITGTKVDMTFEKRRPPLEFNPAQLVVGRHAQKIYGEIDRPLKILDSVAGGGTDAAFAALNTPNPVLERFGLLSFGAHSNDDEYILIDSIEPRLYLATRLIMDFSRGQVR
jgi:glutamate carboxypeptidase